jgi:hypothetical protein
MEEEEEGVIKGVMKRNREPAEEKHKSKEHVLFSILT